MVTTKTTADTKKTNQLSFYLPTGEPVSFCAHAAMGGALALREGVVCDPGDNDSSKKQETLSFDVVVPQEAETTNHHSAASVSHGSDQQQQQSYTATFHDGAIVGLRFQNVPWTCALATPIPVVRRLLRDVHGLSTNIIPVSDQLRGFPHLVHCTVLGRTKTMVFLTDPQDLQQQTTRVPTDAAAYQRVCDTLHTSGLYLYARHPTEPTAWDCVRIL